MKKKKLLARGLGTILVLGAVVGFTQQQKTILSTTTPIIHYVGGTPIEEYPKMTESVDLAYILPEIDILSFDPYFDSMHPLDKYPFSFVMGNGDEKFDEFLQILSQIQLKPVNYENHADGCGIYFDNGRFWVDKSWWWGDYLEEFEHAEPQTLATRDSNIQRFTCTLGDSVNNIYVTITIGSHGLALLDMEELGVNLEAYPCIVDNGTAVIEELLGFCEENTQLKHPEDERMEPIFTSGFPVTATAAISATLS